MSQSKSSGRAVIAAERRQTVLALRRAGYSYERIGVNTGLSKGRCCKIVNEALAEYSTDSASQVEELRRLQLLRIDYSLVAIAAKVGSGHLGAIDRLVRLLERQARLIGLDAPSKISPTNQDGSRYEGGIGMAAFIELVRAKKNGIQGSEE